jgi:hypothetical protein
MFFWGYSFFLENRISQRSSSASIGFQTVRYIIMTLCDLTVFPMLKFCTLSVSALELHMLRRGDLFAYVRALGGMIQKVWI